MILFSVFSFVSTASEAFAISDIIKRPEHFTDAFFFNLGQTNIVIMKWWLLELKIAVL